MSKLPPLLEKLEDEWRRLGCVDIKALRPGLPPETTAGVLRTAGLEPAPELLEWFGWHDGASIEVARDRQACFLWPTMFDFLSLQGALALRSELFTLGAEMTIAAASELGPDWPEATTGYHFEANWLPIGGGGGGELVVEASDSMTCPVFNVSWQDEGFREPRAGSLAEMVELWLHVLRTYFKKTDAPPGWSFEFTDLPIELRVSGLIG